MLTLVSSFGLIFTLLDYLGPKLLEKLFSSDQWTGDKEKRLDKICKSVVDICLLITSVLNYYSELKKTSPMSHFLITSSLLLVSAYVGSLVSGFLLSYLMMMIVLMLPGLHRLFPT